MTESEPEPEPTSDETLAEEPDVLSVWELNNPADGSGLPGSPENPFSPPPLFEPSE